MGREMRTIKFRAWDTKYKTWENLSVPFIEGDMNEQLSYYTTEPYILMQYTGLLDKNGKEIYEGDLLQGDDRIVEVYWSELGIWDCRWLQYTKKPTTRGLHKSEWRNALVIGNVYENPELVK